MAQGRKKIAIGIVGFGKIAQDQHVPAIEGNGAFILRAIADPHGRGAGLTQYPSIDAMLDSESGLDAVAICTPPQSRCALAQRALERGKHVLLEKPPCATMEEAHSLRALAETSGLTLFAAWHSQFAPAIAPAREFLSGAAIRTMHISWREDVRVWHPGQTWIWRQGGFGVFDPGINALSIACRILPQPFFLSGADLKIPGNCETPISAELRFTGGASSGMTASFDWLQTGPQTWNIEIECDRGHLLLSEGGGRLTIDGSEVPLPPNTEYPDLYAHFAALIGAARSDVDLAPLRLVADALEKGRRERAPDFFDHPA